MSSFRDFLRSYNKKEVLPTLKARQKTITFCHDQDIDILKLGCTLPNLARTCLHKSTDTKIFLLMDSFENMLDKIREFDVVGPFLVFIRKTVVDETFITKSKNK